MYKKSIHPFEKHIYLSSPTMHGEELAFVEEAYRTNWMSTIGKNIDVIEELFAKKTGNRYGVGLSCGTSALHLAVKLAGVKRDDIVFCSDMTFSATVNPVSYEGGKQVFIDCDRETWNMDPKALAKAFELFPDTKVVVVAHLYGTPAKIDEIKKICDEHKAFLIEDAAESLGSTYKGKETGSFGQYNIISFNGNKIITGSCGGMLLTDDEDAALKARKWSTQSREKAPWYQHVDMGYNYRLSNVVAGVIRGQFPHLDEHIEQKRNIYFRYKEGLKGLPCKMNPYLEDISVPNHWLSCLIIDKEAMSKQFRGDNGVSYEKESGKTCPSEILDVLAQSNCEGRPIWKPMHMQPIYRDRLFVTAKGLAKTGDSEIVDEDIFERGLCLPSDNKMTEEEQDKIIEIIRSCFE